MTIPRNARKGTGADFTSEEKLGEVDREIIMRKKALKKKRGNTDVQARQLDVMRSVAKDYRRQLGFRR